MADYTSLAAQNRRIVALVAQHPRVRSPEEERGLAAAYLWLAREPQGQVLLEHLAERLLTWCDGPHDEGARRFVLTIFERIAAAETLAREDGL